MRILPAAERLKKQKRRDNFSIVALFKITGPASMSSPVLVLILFARRV